MYFHRVIVAVGLCLIVAGVTMAAGTVSERQEAVKLYVGTSIVAASDPKSAVYVPNFTPAACETMREQRWQTDAATRTSGTATYKCQVERRAIVSFHPAPPPPEPEPAPSAVLSWRAPTHNTSGSALTNLAGYRISYGTTMDLAHTIQVADPGATRYSLSGLSPGTYYFAIRAYNSAGAQSALSNMVQKTVQ